MNAVAIVLSAIGLIALILCVVFFNHPMFRMVMFFVFGVCMASAIACAVVGGGE